MPFFWLGLCLGLALFLPGCKKEEKAGLTAARVHTLTREFARAASGVVGKAGTVHAQSLYGGTGSARTDHLLITLSGELPEQARREQMAQLLQALDRVATANHLTRGPSSGTDTFIGFDYLASGAPTHSIRVNTSVVDRSSSLKPPSSGPQTSQLSARLAIILDDLGGDRGAADAIFALHYPLTISVLPNHAHSMDIAEDAHRRGYEVMLHLPMQSLGEEQPEAQELRPGMPAAEVAGLVDQFLGAVPDAVGANNHQGSQATADPALMSELMLALRERNLFYVDSRTTAATVAFDTAQHAGVRAGFRNVPFLDDVAEASAVRKQLELALRGAREKGEAIAIGHPHPATLEALREFLPRAQAQGVRLVFVSELVY